MKKLLLLAFHLGFLLPHLSSQSMAAYKKSAEEAFAIKDYPTAYLHAKKVLESDSNNIAVLKIAAESAVEVCEFKQADARLDQLESLNVIDDYPEYWFYRAKSNHRRGLYEKAITDYDYFLEVGEAADPALKAIAEVKREECNAWLDYPLPTNANTTAKFVADLSTPGQSDFAMPIYDKNIIVGKLTPPEQCECEKPCSDKMELYQRGTSGERDKLTLPKSFKNIGHITYANKGQRAYFTSCKCKDDTYTCEIYYADRTTGAEAWTKPVKLPNSINRPGYTATQPYFQEREGNGIGRLYYVSNYHKGAPATRDLDVYYTDVQGNTCDVPVNVKAINTTGDEVTPFYHNPTNTLYFSSNGHKTLGGYDFDIFKYSPEGYADANCNNQIQAGSPQVIPLEKPINSIFDDLYFSKEEDTEKMVFSSNRNGHDYAELEHCCPDIFEAVFEPKVDLLVSVFCQNCSEEDSEGLAQVENLDQLSLAAKDAEGNSVSYTKEGNLFQFSGIPLMQEIDIKANNQGYLPGSVKAKSGECYNQPIRDTLFLDPIISLTFNIKGPTDPIIAEQLESMIVTNKQTGEQHVLDKKGGDIVYKLDLCPNTKYEISLESFPDGMVLCGNTTTTESFEIQTSCEPNLFRYDFELCPDTIVPVPLFFDHAIPGPRGATTVNRPYGDYYSDYIEKESLFQDKGCPYNEANPGIVKQFFDDVKLNMNRMDAYAGDVITYISTFVEASDFTDRLKERVQAGESVSDMELARFLAIETSGNTFEEIRSLSDNEVNSIIENQKVELTIQGVASKAKLSKAYSNSDLSKRRISSMNNYLRDQIERYIKIMKQANEGAFSGLQTSEVEKMENLMINAFVALYKTTADPRGDDIANDDAPKTGDCRKYDIRSSRDRRIQLTSIKFPAQGGQSVLLSINQ